MLLHRRGGGQARLCVASRRDEQRVNWREFAEASGLSCVPRWGVRGVGGFWSRGTTTGRGSCFTRICGGVVPECLRCVEAVPSLGVLVGLEVRMAGFVVVWHGIWGRLDWSEEGSVSREYLRGHCRRQGCRYCCFACVGGSEELGWLGSG